MADQIVIAEYPAYKLIAAPAWKRWKHGDKFAIMFPSRRFGDLPHFFTLGSVFGYAVENGDDVMAGYHRAMSNGHKIHWANANAVVLTAGPKAPQETVICLTFGSEIHFEGKRFVLEKAPNDNVSLVEIARSNRV